MFKILKKTQFSEKVFEYRVHAPKLAKKAHAGQFLMVRTCETGERVPFTFANWSPEEGWIEFIFMVIGKTTRCLAELEEGDEIADLTGPLGCPTEIEGDRVAVVGGGVGLAIAYPVARTMCEEGKKVSVIMGARTKDLLILFEQFAALPLENLFITTDDGTMGEKGVVTLPLERLCETDSIDSTFVVGPVPMMKYSTLTCRKYKIPIVASLNPIMVDGTGMCGCCRVEVGGETKFACVDGPDFDASLVDWDDLAHRQATYLAEEADSIKHHEEDCACHRK
ncbi:sulfide dehydrogenase (flavoprotein) subunit SudB [Coriobacterium glomerans PW2]|uniref:Sulfide dehydrogenase (Flavoprotein) subunit SudB n=1 Tax=Coriobacterium glomerans (strain ATCC 49209 / DSM 20642 / JCM 10262 / PW2) TaxID=700015 RepID=F2N992_CORGP|nr:sulfide/dihydroorotate dehydrogenase-like FAD/NAD-binding protein [Coriobacterium glomerans]AEB07840.1 sulfide dehydrogenase (flavoprotein) subunit SudB [Coriobacterium glomerans PW2]